MQLNANQTHNLLDKREKNEKANNKTMLSK